jgi:hypothetical protein
LCVLCFSLVFPGPVNSGSLDAFLEGAKKEGAAVPGITIRKTTLGKPSGEKYIQAFQGAKTNAF